MSLMIWNMSSLVLQKQDLYNVPLYLTKDHLPSKGHPCLPKEKSAAGFIRFE